ncbi:uncharacterized protein H6S33_003001 [Morchella sextelata]|uniref:uncharacterized protein n=1 Tax=Morchella sextelata TaxID=1174677 RepID=UPI001D05B923|nr:uncharacterized protein H6S33_003001 [Morchella sextelata]KAH0607013.1 hypothetical protein H6S33_003001 [Morchella sextelata]
MPCASAAMIFAASLFLAASFSTLVAVLLYVLVQTAVPAFGHTTTSSLALVRGLYFPSGNLIMSLNPSASASPMVLYTEPLTYHQAMNSDDQHLWKKAIQTEKDALDKAHTWDIVNRPTNRAVVKGKWVFKVKHNADGTIERYKARYVAKGFTQVQYQDYDETFAPAARYDSLRLLLALAAHNGWTPQQMDVKSAFLYGVLKEEIYMELPEGYRQDNKVCKLRKCIYGLQQSPREWYACLADSLQRKGFVPAKFDPCIFIHKNHHLYISVYVDDIMIFGPDSPFRKEIRQLLKADFECTDLGNSKFILGIEITVTNNGITLSQCAYINKILDKFGMSNCKPVGTPLEPNLNLHKGDVTGTMGVETMKPRNTTEAETWT